MAVEIVTTQRVVFIDCDDPGEARARFTGKQHGDRFVRQEGDPHHAWAHGECLIRVRPVDDIPTIEVDGKVVPVRAYTYDLTHERYDRWHFAIVDADPDDRVNRYRRHVRIDEDMRPVQQ